jgi:hypothetical protein
MALTPVSSKSQFPKRLTIPRLKQLTAPNKLVFLAVRTKKIQVSPTQYKRVLVQGVAIYWRRERTKVKEIRERYTFENGYDFFEWLTGKVNKRETVYLYSHDVTTDFLSLDGFRQLPVQEFTLQSIYHKLTTTIMRWAKDSRRITILDIQNYYPFTIEKLAQSFKVGAIKEPESDTDKERGLEWCNFKAELIETIIKQLVREIFQEGKGSLRLTASGMANSVYRASYMKHKIVTNHDPEIVEFERSSYVGGFTGLNKLVVPGEPELYKVDVNSMYPSVMYDKKFPTQLIDFAHDVSVRQLERFLDGHSVIAHVTLQAKNSYFPYKTQDNTYYPTGLFETTIATSSLQKALQMDAIKEVHKVAVYLEEPIFAEFVVDTYNKRMTAKDEGNTAHEMLQKSIGNTLYGKFGQLQTETVRVGDAPLDEFCVMDAFSPEDNTNWLEMHAGGSILFIKRTNETRYTSFAIAAHITDYARQKLFSLIEQAGKENVFYCDTDSLIVSVEGLHNLYPKIHQTHLGLLKLEATAGFFIGFAKKDYVFGDVRRSKGFSLGGQRVDENLFTQYQKASFTGAMNKRVSDAPYWKQVNKLYSPFVDGVKIDNAGVLQALNMQHDQDRLGLKIHTLSRVRELVRYTFTDAQKAEAGEWLGTRM